MENSRQSIKYLTIEDILIAAVGHVGDYQFLNLM